VRSLLQVREAAGLEPSLSVWRMGGQVNMADGVILSYLGKALLIDGSRWDAEANRSCHACRPRRESPIETRALAPAGGRILHRPGQTRAMIATSRRVQFSGRARSAPWRPRIAVFCLVDCISDT
jgi:hypothetical protein